MQADLCPNCFEPFPQGAAVCPKCAEARPEHSPLGEWLVYSLPVLAAYWLYWTLVNLRDREVEPHLVMFFLALGVLALAMIRPLSHFRPMSFYGAFFVAGMTAIMNIRRSFEGQFEWWRIPFIALSLVFVGYLWSRQRDFGHPENDEEYQEGLAERAKQARGSRIPGPPPGAPKPAATRAAPPTPGEAAEKAAREIFDLVARGTATPRLLRGVMDRYEVTPATMRPQSLAVYREAVQRFSGDGELSGSEEGVLQRLAAVLELDAESVATVRAVHGPVPEPGALTAAERRELDELCAAFGVSPARRLEPRLALDRLWSYRLALTGPLAADEPGRALEPGERCVAVRHAELWGSRSGGSAAEHPAGPVLDPAALVDGTADGTRGTRGMQSAGEVRAVLTDRRLVLEDPEAGDTAVPLDRVRRVVPFADGLEVHTAGGAPLFLAMDGGADELAMLVDRARREAGRGRG